MYTRQKKLDEQNDGVHPVNWAEPTKTLASDGSTEMGIVIISVSKTRGVHEKYRVGRWGKGVRNSPVHCIPGRHSTRRHAAAHVSVMRVLDSALQHDPRIPTLSTQGAAAMQGTTEWIPSKCSCHRCTERTSTSPAVALGRRLVLSCRALETDRFEFRTASGPTRMC